MASVSQRRVLITERDHHILRSIDISPFTPSQMQRLSATWPEPFTTLRRVQRRMNELAGGGLLRSWQYATTDHGRGATYYKLTPEAFRLLHGDDIPLPHQRRFSDVRLSRQHHTQRLAEFLVHTIVTAHQHGLELVDFRGDHQVRLSVNGESLKPDGAFQLLLPTGDRFNFVVELDNSTESILSRDAENAWVRKIDLYQRHQRQTGTRYRVLVLTTQSAERVNHILAAAEALSPDPNKKLFYGATLADYVHDPAGVAGSAFCDHHGHTVSLVAACRPVQPTLAI